MKLPMDQNPMYLFVVQGTFLDLVQQIESYPKSCQYPLINYLTSAASVSGQAAGPPLVTLASSNFLMPPPPNQSQSSHSSTEDCSGCSNEVRHKLHVRQLFFSFFSIKSSPWTVNDVPKERPLLKDARVFYCFWGVFPGERCLGKSFWSCKDPLRSLFLWHY